MLTRNKKVIFNKLYSAEEILFISSLSCNFITGVLSVIIYKGERWRWFRWVQHYSYKIQHNFVPGYGAKESLKNGEKVVQNKVEAFIAKLQSGEYKVVDKNNEEVKIELQNKDHDTERK